MILDLSESEAMQDLVNSVAEKMALPVAQAIKTAINESCLRTAIDAGWGDIALSCWGHAKCWEFVKLKNPVIDLDLTESEMNIVRELKEKGNGCETDVDAILTLLIFWAGELGFHI